MGLLDIGLVAVAVILLILILPRSNRPVVQSEAEVRPTDYRYREITGHRREAIVQFTKEHFAGVSHPSPPRMRLIK